MSSRTRTALIAVFLLVIAFATLPVYPTASADRSITLSGDALMGWGFTNATITDPGPNLTVVIGETVELTLTGADTTRHNWFIDYNNNLQVDPGEPSSPDFQGGPTGPPPVIVWTFVPDRLGNWTYRCRVHPSTMTGSISIEAATNLTLVGNAVGGWGFSNETMADPGPRIVAVAGANLTLTLIANDSVDHNWFIDYDDDTQVDPGEPSSPDFDGSGPGVWTFTPDRAGNFTYRCRFHPTTMTGNIVVLGEPTQDRPLFDVGLIPGIMILTVGFVLVFAAVYHARSMRAVKRKR